MFLSTECGCCASARGWFSQCILKESFCDPILLVVAMLHYLLRFFVDCFPYKKTDKIPLENQEQNFHWKLCQENPRLLCPIIHTKKTFIKMQDKTNQFCLTNPIWFPYLFLDQFLLTKSALISASNLS